MIIFPGTIAKKHGITIEQASRALSLSRQVTKKPNIWIDVIDELMGLSTIFCIECRKLEKWRIAMNECKDCGVLHCEKHIEGRRCHCCNEIKGIQI